MLHQNTVIFYKLQVKMNFYKKYRSKWILNELSSCSQGHNIMLHCLNEVIFVFGCYDIFNSLGEMFVPQIGNDYTLTCYQNIFMVKMSVPDRMVFNFKSKSYHSSRTLVLLSSIEKCGSVLLNRVIWYYIHIYIMFNSKLALLVIERLTRVIPYSHLFWVPSYKTHRPTVTCSKTRFSRVDIGRPRFVVFMSANNSLFIVVLFGHLAMCAKYFTCCFLIKSAILPVLQIRRTSSLL